MTCTFFGHRDCSESIKEKLKLAIIDLIQNHNATRFLVSNNGNFDSYVAKILSDLKCDFPNIEYYVVLAYLPKNANFSHPTIYPEGIEQIPKRFAISFRNQYMIKQSDFVIAYVAHSFGGAHKFLKIAESSDKTCINLYIT